MSSFKRFAESKISDSSESLQEMKLLRDDHFQPMCWLEDSRTPSLRHEHGDTTTSEERVNNKECSSCHRKGAKRNHDNAPQPSKDEDRLRKEIQEPPRKQRYLRRNSATAAMMLGSLQTFALPDQE